MLSFKISKVHSSDRLHIGLIFCPDLHVSGVKFEYKKCAIWIRYTIDKCDHISDQTWMNCRSFEYKLANSCTAPISLNVIEHNNQFCANSYILLKNFISKCDEIPVQIHLAKYYSLMRLRISETYHFLWKDTFAISWAFLKWKIYMGRDAIPVKNLTNVRYTRGGTLD